MWYAKRMLSEDEKRQIQLAAAEQMRQQWGDIRPVSLAAAVDDIRARLVEEGWFGKPLIELSQDMQRSVALQDLYGTDSREALTRELEAKRDRDDVAELD